MPENNNIEPAVSERKKKTYAFQASVAELIQTHKYVKDDNETEFVAEAIRRYCAEIDGEKSLDIFYDRIAKLFRAELANSIGQLSHLEFKTAVETCKTNLMVGASLLEMTDAEMRELDNRAYALVRKHHGYIYLKDAIKDEQAFISGE